MRELPLMSCEGHAMAGSLHEIQSHKNALKFVHRCTVHCAVSTGFKSSLALPSRKSDGRFLAVTCPSRMREEPVCSCLGSPIWKAPKDYTGAKNISGHRCLSGKKIRMALPGHTSAHFPHRVQRDRSSLCSSLLRIAPSGQTSSQSKQPKQCRG